MQGTDLPPMSGIKVGDQLLSGGVIGIGHLNVGY
jgi:hypothetical protein